MKMNYIELPKKQNRRKNPLDDYIFTSKVRISRNVDGLRFPYFLDQKSTLALEGKFVEEISKLDQDIEFLTVNDITKSELLVFIATKVLTTDFLRNGRVFAYKRNGDFVLLFNEEDHLKIFSIESGYNITLMYKRISAFFDQLEENIDFAYDEEFGYLTSSIFNVGTALKLSVMMNLSGIVYAGKIDVIKDIVKEMSYSIQPLISFEKPLFIISTSYSLGSSEEEMIEEFEDFLIKIIKYEKECREKFLFSNKNELERIFRKLYDIKRLNKVSYSVLIDYISIIDLFNKVTFQVDDINYIRNLVFKGIDDYIVYKHNVNSSMCDDLRADLIRRAFDGLKFKKAFI